MKTNGLRINFGGYPTMLLINMWVNAFFEWLNNEESRVLGSV
jgi:hypothetical protein